MRRPVCAAGGSAATAPGGAFLQRSDLEVPLNGALLQRSDLAVPVDGAFLHRSALWILADGAFLHRIGPEVPGTVARIRTAMPRPPSTGGLATGDVHKSGADPSSTAADGHGDVVPPLDLPRVFLGSHAVAQGWLTRKQLRGPLVRRLMQNVYAPAGVSKTHKLHVEGVGLLLPPGCMVTSRSAATVLGAPLAVATDAVDVLLPEGSTFGPYRGVALRRFTDPPGTGRRWRDVALAPADRIAFDLAARRPLPDAVALVDAFARAQPSWDTVAWRVALDTVRWSNVVHVRKVAELIDARAESLPESRLRVVLVTAGIDVEPQVQVSLPGLGRVRLDLAVRGRKVAVEYDGGWHVLREQLERDRARVNALHLAGWEVVHVTADLLARPRSVVGAVRGALAGPAGVR